MEKVLLRMQTVIGDTRKQISEHYRQVVQLEEQLSDNLWQLHFCQGVVESMGQVRSFMGEGDLPQSLMRLQNARVDVYCELSKNFEVKVTLNKALSKLKDELGMVKGMATVDKNEATVADNSSMQPNIAYWVSMKHLPDTATDDYYTYYI